MKIKKKQSQRADQFALGCKWVNQGTLYYKTVIVPRSGLNYDLNKSVFY